MTVRIVEVEGSHREWISVHNATNDGEARRKAVKKYFGKRAFFYSSSELNTNTDSNKKYGQVFKPLIDSNTSLTDRVFIEIWRRR